MILIINIKLNYTMVICYVHFAESFVNDQQNDQKNLLWKSKLFAFYIMLFIKVKQV